MIDFIFGDAGAGKSEYIYSWITKEAILHPENNYYLFVPEQNTLKAQRELIEHSERHGMLNLDVLSFQLLAYRVMDELGLEKPVLIDDVSKSILIRKAAAAHADELKVYGSKIGSDGFIKRMKSIISEFCQYDISFDKLKEAEDTSGLPLLKAKLSDISIIYRSFRELLSERKAIPEDLAYMLLSCISRSELLRDAVIVFDGYTGFTPVQERLLEHIIPMAARCRFAVTIPMSAAPYCRVSRIGMENPDISDMYMLSRETIARVCRIAELNGIALFGETEIKSGRKAPEVRLIRAGDRTEEVRFAARSLRLNAVQKGIRYSRMAVAVSDPPSYAEIIRNELSREGIPYFTDDRAEAVNSPAVAYIRAALRLVSRGYMAEDITGLFKNPLVTLNAELQELADLADNYLRKTGKRGRCIYEKLAEQLRLYGVTELEAELKAAGNIRDMSEAVRRFTEKTELESRVEAYAAETEKAGFIREAGECRRFNEEAAELLDRLSVILGDDSCSIEEFRKLMDAGFSDMKGGAIPETMDTVLIGDLKRSRLDDIDVLYVLGANDGLLPQAVSGGGIFTDYERIEIMSHGIELAPDDKTDSTIQRFYLKLLLNKPAKQLTVSYAAAGADGKAMRPSPVINELMQGAYGEFDNIESIDLTHMYGDGSGNGALDAVDAGMISSADDAVMYIADKVQHVNADDEAFFDTLRALRRAGREEELDRLKRAAFTAHTKDRLSEAAAAELYRELLQGSVTRLERYESCPFSQFAGHGLGLKERESFDIRAADIGNIYHDTLDIVFRELKERNQDIRELDDSELAKMAEAAGRSAVEAYNENMLDSSARSRYIADKLRRITGCTVRTLKRQLDAGDFKTKDTECEFSIMDDRLRLKGRIDRVDVFEDGQRALVSIIDYKSGNKEFSLTRLIGGLDLQLITYMSRALKELKYKLSSGNEPAPAGMFYYRIDEPVIGYRKGISPEEIEKARADRLKLSGAVIGTEDVIRHVDRGLGGNGTNSSNSSNSSNSANSITGITNSGSQPDGQNSQSGADSTKETGILLDKKAVSESSVIDKSSEVLTEQEFNALMRYADERIRRDTDAILKGDIDARPYRLGGRTGCDYCRFRSMCGFDTSVEGFDYRNIRSISGRDGISTALRGLLSGAETEDV